MDGENSSEIALEAEADGKSALLPGVELLRPVNESARGSGQVLTSLFLFLYAPVVYYFGFFLMNGIVFDFPSLYYASRMAFVFGVSPYGLSKFAGDSIELGRKIHPYLYPPPSLLAIWPLANLTIWQAQAAVLVVSHLCFLGSLWLLLFRLTPLPLDQTRRSITVGLILVFALVSDAVLKTFALGQINFIVLLFVCLSMSALRNEGSDWRIAAPLSIAILLKTYPALLLLPLLLRKRYRATGLTCGFIAAVTVLSGAVLPISVWTDWLYEIAPLGAYGNNAISAGFIWNQSLNGFMVRLIMPSEFAFSPASFPHLVNPIVTAFAFGMTLTTLAVSYLCSKRADYRRIWDFEICAFLLLIFLIAPLSWDHHLVYLLPVAGVCLCAVVNGQIPKHWRPAVAICLFLMAWNIPIDHPRFRSGWWTLLGSSKLYPVLVLWFFCLVRMRSHSPDSNTPALVEA